MQIQTRYRDIPYSEVQKCMTVDGLNDPRASAEAWETNARGRSVSIITPAIKEHQWQFLKCQGPFYDIEGQGSKHAVCIHIVEIGD